MQKHQGGNVGTSRRRKREEVEKSGRSEEEKDREKEKLEKMEKWVNQTETGCAAFRCTILHRDFERDHKVDPQSGPTKCQQGGTAIREKKRKKRFGGQKNHEERLVNGLAADGWRVDVFLFLFLGAKWGIDERN